MAPQLIVEPPLSPEDKLSLGLERVRNGEPVRAVARAMKVDRSTLRRRLLGVQSRRVSAQARLRLTPEQEQDIVNWICHKRAEGRPPTYAAIHRFASIMRLQTQDTTPLGRNWIQRFIKRHGQKIESVRVASAASSNSTVESESGTPTV